MEVNENKKTETIKTRKDIIPTKYIEGIGKISLMSYQKANEKIPNEFRYDCADLGAILFINDKPSIFITLKRGEELLKNSVITDFKKNLSYSTKKAKIRYKSFARFRIDEEKNKQSILSEMVDNTNYDNLISNRDIISFIDDKLGVIYNYCDHLTLKERQDFLGPKYLKMIDDFAGRFGFESNRYPDYIKEKRVRKKILKRWMRKYKIQIIQKSPLSNSIYGVLIRDKKKYKVRISDHEDSGIFSGIEPTEKSITLMLQIIPYHKD